MTQESFAPVAVPFDLDEDSVPDMVAADTNGDGAIDVIGFDLDEDSVSDTVAADTNSDGAIDVIGFDLDEDSVIDAVVADTDGDGLLDAGTGFDLDADRADYVADVDEPPTDDPGIDDDSLYSPPDNIDSGDLSQAQGDVEHSELMNEYMMSRGLIS